MKLRKLDFLPDKGVMIFLLCAVITVGVFIWISNNLVRDLAQQERERMELWADATKEIVSVTSSEDAQQGSANIDFLLSIIEGNHTIPVLLTDDSGIILDHRNFDLPEPVDSLNPYELSDANSKFLYSRLKTLRQGKNVIHIVISENDLRHLYYDDSKLLKRLSYYPYIQLGVMLVFIIVVYLAVSSSKQAEQNKVWVGLSKETAHQLGTPISSLMAWMEILRASDVPAEYVAEMDKDVSRLAMIASRFSKIGSAPTLEDADAGVSVAHAAEYMKGRISSRINLEVERQDEELPSRLSPALFEWVMENLIKNAVDAMDGSGAITVSCFRDGENAVIRVSDTGKGMSRSTFKRVFKPGFTTKKRGWGLGLTLARRIVEQYHKGKIYVESSEPGQGTVFRIDIPLIPKE